MTQSVRLGTVNTASKKRGSTLRIAVIKWLTAFDTTKHDISYFTQKIEQKTRLDSAQHVFKVRKYTNSHILSLPATMSVLRERGVSRSGTFTRGSGTRQNY